jgi:hypothetical protein
MRKNYILAIFILSSCFSISIRAQETDTISMTNDCMTQFFSTAAQPASPKTIKIVTKAGKILAYPAFKKQADMTEYSREGLFDLDRDGKKELVLFNFTGGAHCCDEFYIFRNTGPGRYQYANHLFGGDVCISDSGVITYNFTEHFGYFFTCFACEYPDTSDTAPIYIREISLIFSKGKLAVIKGDKDLRATINDNLGKLSEQPYQQLGETDFDEGLRKEFAMNLAIYYYSFGKNLMETKNLFTKYYKFPDAKKVWSEFSATLLDIHKMSDF